MTSIQPYDPTDDDDAPRIVASDEALEALTFIYREHGAVAILRSVAQMMEMNPAASPTEKTAFMDGRRLVLAIANEIARIERGKERIRA